MEKENIKKEAFSNPASPILKEGKMLYEIPDEDRSEVLVTEDIVFAMEDNRGVFSIGLTTILQALMLAEENNLVPEIPKEWKYEVMNRYMFV